MFTNFAVLGDGAWGTAIAIMLAQNAKHQVTLWSAFEENGRILREKRENVRLLPGIAIPESIVLTTDIATALAGVDLAIAAIPTVYLRETLKRSPANGRRKCRHWAWPKDWKSTRFCGPRKSFTRSSGCKTWRP